MTEKTPTQAVKSDDPGKRDTPPKGGEAGEVPADKGAESAGGAYPNPHTGKEGKGESGDWHGGQSETAYHGSPTPVRAPDAARRPRVRRALRRGRRERRS
jgi:hypothetical protein